MRSTVEPLEGNKVKLSVEVDADEFDKAVDAGLPQARRARSTSAASAREGAPPGARGPPRRPGRRPPAGAAGLPARLLRRGGADPRGRRHRLRPRSTSPPAATTGPVAFDAVVEVRPTVAVEGYDHLEVTVPVPSATDEDIDERSTACGRSSPTSRPRPARRRRRPGAHRHRRATRTARRSRGSSPTTTSTRSARARSCPRSTSTCAGRRPATSSSSTPPTPRRTRATSTSGCWSRRSGSSVMPELTDEWVAENTEQSTVEELRADLKEQLDRGPARRRQHGAAAAHGRGPRRPGRPTTCPSRWSTARSRPAPELRRPSPPAEPRPRPLPAADRYQPGRPGRPAPRAAEQAIKVDLALRAVAEAEGLEANDEDLDKHFAELARQYGMAAEEIRHNFEHAGQMLAVRSEIRKGKALDWVLERVAIVDEDGNRGRPLGARDHRRRRAGGPIYRRRRSDQTTTNRLTPGEDARVTTDRPGRRAWPRWP